MKTITISTHTKDQIVDITDEIGGELEKGTVLNGLVTIFVSHTTCAITTADLDPGTDKDFLDFLRNIVPEMKFRHPHDPSYAPDHLLSSIIGPMVTIPFQYKKLILGTWQRVILVELNGPRERSVTISF